MTVVVCGLSTVGAAMAATLLEHGHAVIGVDLDPVKRLAAAAGAAPVNEPGMAEAFAKGRDAGRLRTASDLPAAVADPAVHTVAIAVGTPQNERGALSLAQLIVATDDAIRGILQRPPGHPPVLVCYRSTMPPGTCRDLLLPRLERALGPAGQRFEIAYHPEFLRMGHAMADSREPGRIVLGERFPGATARLHGIYGNIRCPLIELDLTSAELAKMADNTWRANKVAFANEVARLAMASGGDPQGVMEVLCADERFNLSAAYLQPGLPYGGSCLPKDSTGVAEAAREWGVAAPLLGSIARSNAVHADNLARSLIHRFSDGARVLQVGLGFKPGSDDLRDSPLVALAERLISAGVDLALFDPNIPDLARVPTPLRPYIRTRPDTAPVDTILLGHPWPEGIKRPTAEVIDLCRLSGLAPAL